jgi:hypothetical protein
LVSHGLVSRGIMVFFVFDGLFCFIQILRNCFRKQTSLGGVVILLFLLDSLLIHVVWTNGKKQNSEILNFCGRVFTFIISFFPLVNKFEKFIKERQTK